MCADFTASGEKNKFCKPFTMQFQQISNAFVKSKSKHYIFTYSPSYLVCKTLRWRGRGEKDVFFGGGEIKFNVQGNKKGEEEKNCYKHWVYALKNSTFGVMSSLIHYILRTYSVPGLSSCSWRSLCFLRDRRRAPPPAPPRPSQPPASGS